MAQSIHKSEWPTAETSRFDESIAKQGRALLEVIALSRRKKADSGLSLKTPIRALEIYTNPEQLTVLRENEEVILRMLKAENSSSPKHEISVSKYPRKSTDQSTQHNERRDARRIIA